MKVKCIQNDGITQCEGSDQWVKEPNGLAGSLTIGKIYEVLEIERNNYRIIDDEGEDYLYPTNMFEVIGLSSLERHFLDRKTVGMV